jgi:DHA1 family multidrug resistance protein-like MFS transporter
MTGEGERLLPEIHREGIKKPVLFSFLMVVALVEFIKMGVIIMFLPSLFESLKYSKTVLGWVLSANLLADNLCKSATGWFVDREGPWPVLFIGCLTVLTGLILLANFHNNVILTIVAAVLIGIGGSPTWPAAITGSIKINGEERRASTISLISIVWLLGGGLGIFLVGLLLSFHPKSIPGHISLGTVNPYTRASALLILVAAVIILVSAAGWATWRKVVGANPQLPFRHSERERFKAVLQRILKVCNLIPGMFFQTFSLGMLLPNLLPYAVGKLGLSELQYYLLLLVGGGIVVLFMNPVGRLTDRLGPRIFLVSGFLLAAISLWVLSACGNAFNIWVIVIFIGLSYALIQPAWNSVLAASIPPGQRGVLMGLFMSIEGLGFALGPAFGGWLSEVRFSGFFSRVDSVAPFLVSGIFLMIMAFVYLFHRFHNYNFEEK